MTPASQAVVVLCTTPDESSGRQLANQVLQEKLAACVTLLPGATSFYYWDDKLQQDNEIQLIVKTDSQHQQALLQRLKVLHPYQTPELLVLPVIHGDPQYLSWLTESLN